MPSSSSLDISSVSRHTSCTDAFGDAAAEVFAETRDHSPLATEVDDSFQANLREIGGTMAKFEGTFVNQRNRVLGLT